MLKELGEPKLSYVSMKDTEGPVKAAGTYLVFFELVILMQDKMLYFKIGLSTKFCCFSEK